MKLLKYFNIPDLILLAVVLLALKLGYLDRQTGLVQALGTGKYLLFSLAILLVMAGGFFANNVFGNGRDYDADLNEAKSYNIYAALNVIGIGIIYYLANSLNKPMLLTGFFMIVAAVMYLYATGIKQIIVLSNVLFALWVAFPVVAVGLFQLYPLIGIVDEETNVMIRTIFSIFTDFSIFAFATGLVLSFVNDLAYSDADYNSGANTLPIAIGRERAAKITMALTIIPLVMLVYYTDKYLTNLIYALGYSLVFVGGLLLFVMLRLFHAKAQKDFVQIAGLLKLVLLFALVSLIVISFNIQHVK